jgi:predicted short-subunit dehydrogenase-like oxidoreductase (DUF2520 family)
MKAFPALLTALLLSLSATAHALTSEQTVTPDYVRSHPDRVSVQSEKNKDGLIAFTVKFRLKQPQYVVAHLSVQNGDQLLARSDTPAFTKNVENTFYFALSEECLASSEFTLGVSHFVASGDEAVPIPGTIEYRFRLADFVSADLLKKR